jgi:zinc transport system substrate-binding protein
MPPLSPVVAVALALISPPALAAPRVVVDIAPVHSIVAAVMAGVGAPDLLIRPGVSEHDAALRPSDAAALDAANVVVWVGPDLTPWLEKPLGSLAEGATRVTLIETPGLSLLPRREGGTFEAHEHGEEENHDHAQDGPDPHLWLDPENAAAIAEAVAEALAATDPDGAAAYRANAANFRAETAALAAALAPRLAAARDRPFVVFHDAYRYFEDRFGLPAAGAIATSDAAPPSAARLAEIRALVAEVGAVCVFAEPQFDQRLVATVTEGTAARAGTLDPLGVGLTPGPALYPALLQRLADSLVGCLAPPA